MKKNVTVNLALVAIFALAGLVAAQYTKPDTGKSAKAMPAKSTPAAPATPVTKAPQKAKAKSVAMSRQVTGTVVSVDAVANTVVIKGKKGDVTFHVASDAKIKVGGKAVTLGDIGMGSRVTVTYKLEHNVKVATAVR